MNKILFYLLSYGIVSVGVCVILFMFLALYGERGILRGIV
jgi:hypothetical protein